LILTEPLRFYPTDAGSPALNIVTMKTAILLGVSFLSALSPLISEAGDLAVDAQKSWVKVDASATGHTFSGSLSKFDAKVSGDPASLAPSSATLQWDFSDLKTNDAKRDAEMLKWLEYAKNQSGTFSMTKTWTDAAGKTWAQGNLKIHGISKSLAFPLTTSKTGDRLKIDGSVWIDYQDFSLPIIRNMAVMTVDPKLKISFHLEGDVK
jgi:polyisoprenoid-binding protein YceI